MAVVYNRQSTVTDGLVLCLDAGNSKSYPGSGTAWTDLSGRGNVMTLLNSPVYSTTNGGIITFDGVDDHATNNNTNFSIANNLFADANGSWTVSAWFRFPTSPSGTRTGNASWSIVGRAGGIATGATCVLFVGSATDTTFGSYAPYYCASVIRGAVTVISPTSVNDNLWHNVTVTWNGSAGSAYFDGKSRGALNIGAAAIQTLNVEIGRTGNSSHLFEGAIPAVSIYNRALSAAEVTQNFNALRGRFGI